MHQAKDMHRPELNFAPGAVTHPSLVRMVLSAEFCPASGGLHNLPEWAVGIRLLPNVCCCS